MNRDEMLQRFDSLSGSTANSYFEVVADKDDARIVFRETAHMVKGGRGCFSLFIIGTGLAEIMAISEYLPALKWLLMPFSIASSLGAYWYVQQKSVADDEKSIHFEIDVQTQTILLPVEAYKPQHRTALNVDDVLAFYSWQEDESDGTRHSLRCTYGKDEEVVVLLENNRMDLDYCTRLLGFLCDKDVWKRNKNSKIYPLKTADLLS